MSRSTSNKHVAGGPTTRRKRHERLVQEFRADLDAVVLDGRVIGAAKPGANVEGQHTIEPACRCYRCGALLTADTVTADRIVPGCEGGEYTEANERPACGGCNSTMGGRLGAARRKARALASAS